jgi:hypothetical protein
MTFLNSTALTRVQGEPSRSNVCFGISVAGCTPAPGAASCCNMTLGLVQMYIGGWCVESRCAMVTPSARVAGMLLVTVWC